jgi:hypothetical protein
VSSFCLHQMFFDANRGDVAIVGQTATTTTTPNKLIRRMVCQNKRDKQICIPISKIVRDKVVTTTIPRSPKLPYPTFLAHVRNHRSILTWKKGFPTMIQCPKKLRTRGARRAWGFKCNGRKKKRLMCWHQVRNRLLLQ